MDQEKNKPKRTLRVALNGTDVNPVLRLGLRQNPFPQTASRETDEACQGLQSLGGNPIPHDKAEQVIRKALVGFSEEFVRLCVLNFRPGEYREFSVEWSEA